MDESKVIDDILNQLYNYDNIFKSGDKELIQKKKREKNEKQEELIKQIELMCSTLEKELRNEMGEDFFKVKKGLRAFVIDSIQKEVKNGNNVIGSDGKINFKKISMRLLAQKNEIVNERKSNSATQESEIQEILEETSETFTEKFDIKNFFEENGIELSEEEIKIIENSVKTTDELFEEFKRREKAGEKRKDIIKDILEKLSPEEMKALRKDATRAAFYHSCKSHHSVKKDKNLSIDALKQDNYKGSYNEVERNNDSSYKDASIWHQMKNTQSFHISEETSEILNNDLKNTLEKVEFLKLIFEAIEPDLEEGLEEASTTTEKGLIDGDVSEGSKLDQKLHGLFTKQISESYDYKIIKEMFEITEDMARQTFGRENQVQYIPKSNIERAMETFGVEIDDSGVGYPEKNSYQQLQKMMEAGNIEFDYQRQLSGNYSLHKKTESFGGVKSIINFVQENSTEKGILDTSSTLGQAAKEGVIVDGEREEDKTHENAEPQTTGSEPKKSDDEVK